MEIGKLVKEKKEHLYRMYWWRIGSFSMEFGSFFFCMILMDDVMICISMRACMHMWRFECFDYLGREEEEEGRKGLRFEK